MSAGWPSVPKRAVGQLLVGVDDCGLSHVRVARELLLWQCARHQIGWQRPRVVRTQWPEL